MVVTWFCASVFGSFVMLSPALRVFEVMMASRSNCSLLFPCVLKYTWSTYVTIDVSERDLLHNPRVVSGRSHQHVEAATAAHS